MTLSQQDTEAFEEVLQYLKQTRAFDFTGYKRTSLRRRIGRRMDLVNIKSYSEYQDYLEVHPDEFAALFDTILINVTQFFRDTEAWDYVRRETIPDILSTKSDGEPIRIWSAGCATGAEAYTLAIVFAEAIGPEQFRERVKIYATDVDEDALSYARQATFTPKEIEEIPKDLSEKYFEPVNGRYGFRTDLRRSVIFGGHNLTEDAPISRLDLLVCRNTLMYFNAETQAEILSRFHFALNQGLGYLFLGRAEMLVMHSPLFSPVDLQYRIFKRSPAPGLRERLYTMNQGSVFEDRALGKMSQLRQVAFDNLPIAMVAIDLKGVLSFVNAEARKLFKLTTADVGRPFHELELSYRPVELRSRIEQVQTEKHPIRLSTTEWHVSKDDVRYLEIEVIPAMDEEKNLLGTSVVFFDVTVAKQLRLDLQRSHEELETAYEELQSTNEELETTNEELQSTIEELETTNEELQSTNEELETMNEELQSTNEELRTSNTQLEERTGELNGVNALLESIVGSFVDGVAVLDRKLGVQIWNASSEELWGLRSDEVTGRHFLNLDIGLPIDKLTIPIRKVQEKESKVEVVNLEAVNRRGKTIQIEATIAPLKNGDGQNEGVILLMKQKDGS